jgi:hypothetical protein
MITKSELETKTSSELVAIFNSLDGVKPTKRFPSKEIGIARILKTIGEEKRVLNKKRGRKRVEPIGTYNLSNEGMIQRTFRPNSGRGKLVEYLLEGKTFSELLELLQQWDEKQLDRHIRNTNWYGGWNLKTDENGVIRVTR